MNKLGRDDQELVSTYRAHGASSSALFPKRSD